MRYFFAKRGWQCFWGCPLDTRGGGYVEHPLGRCRWPGEGGPHCGAGEAPPQARVRPLGVGPLTFHPVGWVHVHVAPGDSATVLHAVSVYGVVGHRESYAAVREDVRHHLFGLGHAAHIAVLWGRIATSH